MVMVNKKVTIPTRQTQKQSLRQPGIFLSFLKKEKLVKG
jgi:hypothetical protein